MKGNESLTEWGMSWNEYIRLLVAPKETPSQWVWIKKFKKQIIFSKKSFQSPKSGVEKRPWGIKGGALSFSARKRPFFIIDRDNCSKLEQKNQKIRKKPEKIRKKIRKRWKKPFQYHPLLPSEGCNLEIRKTKNREYIQKKLNQEEKGSPGDSLNSN